MNFTSRMAKIVKIIPIKKSNKNSCSPGDYRPTAPTCATSKILEKMVLIKLQVTILNPTFFTLYTAGIEKPVSISTSIQMFSDFIVHWSSRNLIDEIESELYSSL
ncbi:hypothetical protein TNCT_710531 [Trichonephila clavata]|uniref:Uncharacterized protein n=1 Tax=Trichonephila clavata TaxID=2740835 RepID=A0A8X6H143_TRICU|nr:hypothetical protein TNCT_710531 [Trichonephila clavata]